MEDQVLTIEDLRASIGAVEILKGIRLGISQNRVTAVMGPSGCGKTTLIRCINRMHELVPGAEVSGTVLLKGEDVYAMPTTIVRRRIGLVFQKPNPFPTMSVYNNVVAGYTLNSIPLGRAERDGIVEESLTRAALWEEVKDHLHRNGTFLSGGQQQRLCIARALAMSPEVLLLDEPTSALDPKATSHIEDLIGELKKSVTIVLVTHNIAQAARVSDYAAFLFLGEMIEYDTTERLFTVPKDKRTDEYLRGIFG